MTVQRSVTVAARPIQPVQRRTIHAIRRAAGLDEASYRGLLAGQGAASSNDLTEGQADAVIARLRALQPAKQDRARADGPFAKKLWALWISGWNLGVIRNNSDAALHAFMEDRFGVSHSRFLIDQHQAGLVIEGLKAWLERSAGVDWPNGRTASAAASMRAVLVAQWRRAVALESVSVQAFPAADDGLREFAGVALFGDRGRLSSLSDPSLGDAELRRLTTALGIIIRGCLSAGAAGGDDE